jgi:hypothetical protein
MRNSANAVGLSRKAIMTEIDHPQESQNLNRATESKAIVASLLRRLARIRTIK